MSDLNTKLDLEKVLSYSRQPTAVMAYVFPEPMEIGLSAAEQGGRILRESCLAECNRGALDLFDIDDPEQIRDLSMETMVLGRPSDNSVQILAAMEQRLTRFVANGYKLSDMPSQWVFDGVPLLFTVDYEGFVENGQLQRVLVIYRDDSVKQYQENLVLNIAQRLVSHSEEAFFSQLTENLAKTLEVDQAVVLEVVEGLPGVVRPLAVNGNDQPMDDIRFEVVGTPAKAVMAGDVIVIEEGVSEQYPDAARLAGMNINAYVGVPLYGENYQVLGMVALLHSGRLANIELARSVLSIFPPSTASCKYGVK